MLFISDTGTSRGVLLAVVVCVQIAWCHASECPDHISGDTVYFGNGQFNKTQYMLWRMEQIDPFARPIQQTTALSGYAGGFATGPSPNEQVCGSRDIDGSYYGGLGHTQAVQVTLSEKLDKAAVQFEYICRTFFELSFVNSSNVWLRRDPNDRGRQFRNIIGVPGGLGGALGDIIRRNNINNMPLLHGGNKNAGWDEHDEGVVYIYDTNQYPFFRAERYLQFQADQNELPPQAYLDWTPGNLSLLGRINLTCGEPNASTTQNIIKSCCPKKLSVFDEAHYGPAVYFGDGSFYHTQYDMYSVERSFPFSRTIASITARSGYGGGVGSGPFGLVCGANGVPRTHYSDFGYAQAVQIILDKNPRRARQELLALATQYFNNSFVLQNTTWTREDPNDRGPQYRNIIGLPGGVHSELFPIIESRNVHRMAFVEGGKARNGILHDNRDEGIVYIYDTAISPFFRAPRLHQFHRDAILLRRNVTSSYLVEAKAAMVNRNLIDPICGEDNGQPPFESNLEAFSCPKIPQVHVTTSLEHRTTLYTSRTQHSSSYAATSLNPSEPWSTTDNPSLKTLVSTESTDSIPLIAGIVIGCLSIALGFGLLLLRRHRKRSSHRYVAVSSNPIYSIRENTGQVPELGSEESDDCMLDNDEPIEIFPSASEDAT